MKWMQTGTRGLSACNAFTEEETVAIKRQIDAFLAACKKRYPGIDKNLEQVLSKFSNNLPQGGTLSHRALKLFLRWCITEGGHLQDERRDIACRLWATLFPGPIPHFYWYNSVTKEYVESLDEYLAWCAVQGGVEPALCV
jgi:hypothetical protein